MKKSIFTLLLSILALTAVAQKDVTKFLGIPVDGTKSEMIRKLKAKGFRSTTYDRNILEGEFNGHDVTLHIITNNNKVWRIMVAWKICCIWASHYFARPKYSKFSSRN